MSNVLIIGYTADGKTDERFLGHVIRRTFEQLAFDCAAPPDIYPEHFIAIPSGLNFTDRVLFAAKEAYNIGAMVLCVHTDAEAPSADMAVQSKIDPAKSALAKQVAETANSLCDNLVAVVPIHMTEAWMLANPALLADEINAKLTIQQLGLHKSPESYKDPKEVIEKAIKADSLDKAKRHRTRKKSLHISDLYQPIGQKVKIADLLTIPSYKAFYEEVREAYRKLNYLH